MNKLTAALAGALTLNAAGCEDSVKQPPRINISQLEDTVLKIAQNLQRQIASGDCVVDFNKWERRWPEVIVRDRDLECSDRNEVFYGGYEHPHAVTCETSNFTLYDRLPSNPPAELTSANYPTNVDGFSLNGVMCDEPQNYNAKISSVQLSVKRDTHSLHLATQDESLWCGELQDDGTIKCTSLVGDEAEEFFLDEDEVDAMINRFDKVRMSLMSAARENRAVHECGDSPSWGTQRCYDRDRR